MLKIYNWWKFAWIINNCWILLLNCACCDKMMVQAIQFGPSRQKSSWDDSMLRDNVLTHTYNTTRKYCLLCVCVCMHFRASFGKSIYMLRHYNRKCCPESTTKTKGTVLRFMDFIKTANAYQMVCRRSLFCSLFAVYSCVCSCKL